MKRRERTRQLIELGGLVAKAGLIDLTDDDRAVLFGAFLQVAGKLSGEEREQALLIWRRRGKRAFEEDAQAKADGG
ncbi:conjugal transfer protein TraD [Flavisphingomonas formosensis]|uniref:conjugal transfer protein TraD n=1 Tax=Flavisphingomonas formosensis TaxID=861534 RepID=UPI002FCCEBDD